MAKTDMERVGLFSEMGYATINDPWVPLSSKPYNESAGKGKQMMIGGTKTKTAQQAGYFGKTFDRVLEGEAYSDPVKLRRQLRLKESKKNIGKSWVPSSGTKETCGVGNHYGTLGGPIQAVSAAQRPKDKYKSPGMNFLTNPAKRGTGYGFVGVTIGPGHKYSSEPYDRAREQRKNGRVADTKKVKGGPFKLNSHPNDFFDSKPYSTDKPLPPIKEPKTTKDKPKPFKPSSPAKLVGGCKAGTFEPYPTHSQDPYGDVKKHKDTSGAKARGVFHPSPGTKSMPTRSVVQMHVDRRMNCTNFLTTAPVS